MPQVDRAEENRRYALCFFPLIGAVIGGALMLWYHLCGVLEIGSGLFSAVAVSLPVLITGGIHLDGFCDVHDAKASMGKREKMLEIMSDPHIGAFAAIHLVLLILIQYGLFLQITDRKTLLICSLGFVQSRAWSGLAAVTFRSAKNTGALQNFTRPADKNITAAVEIFFLALTCAAMICTDNFTGVCSAAGGAAAFIYYRVFSYKKFGGITGDIAGYFLQLCELAIMMCAVFSERIGEVLL